MAADLSDRSLKQLLQLNSAIVSELRARDACRTSNNPLGDVAEHLFSKAFGWTLETNSRAGFDAIDNEGRKYQIKSRRISPGNPSRQAGDIRRLGDSLFDFIAGVVFSELHEIHVGMIIPHRLVLERALKIDHTNSSRIYLRDDWLRVPGVLDVTHILSETWKLLNEAA